MAVQASTNPPMIDRTMNEGLRTAGVIVATLGVAAMILPGIATLLIEQIIALVLLFWGASGLVLAVSLRRVPAWRPVAAWSALVLLLGLALAAYPGAGAAVMTALLVLVFFAEGVASCVASLRLRRILPGWQWSLLSGVFAIAVAVLIVIQWPMSSGWVLGFLAGLNLLSSGIAIFLMSRL